MKQEQVLINQQLTDPLVWLRTSCSKNGLSVSDGQIAALGHYVHLLLEWNEKINLISRRDEENIWQSHILHSIAPLFRLKIPETSRIVDLGTGGGLPGIPLKILNPSVSMTMIDSTQKKITAVSTMIKDLNLPDATAVWGRAEELGKRKDLNGRFELAVARGVGPLNELAVLALPFLAPAKHNPKPPVRCLLAYKGGDLESEIAKTRLNKAVTGIEEVTLAGEGLDPAAEKKLVIVQF